MEGTREGLGKDGARRHSKKETQKGIRGEPKPRGSYALKRGAENQVGLFWGVAHPSQGHVSHRFPCKACTCMVENPGTPALI